MTTVLGRFIALVHADRPPSDSDWDAYVAQIDEVSAKHGNVAVLVDSPGPGPNAMQRARLNLLAAKRNVRVAVVSDSLVARGIIAAFGWTEKIQIRQFGPGAHEEACTYLEATPDETMRLRQAISSLKHRIGR